MTHQPTGPVDADARIAAALEAERAAHPTEFAPGTLVQAQAPVGIPTLTGQDDLAAVLARPLATLAWPDGSLGLQGGDIVVIAAKAVARAEGRFVADPARDAPTPPTDGLSRLEIRPGAALAKPLDPDGSARTLRVGLQARLGPRVGVIVAATVPRSGPGVPPGTTQDVALGVAGLALTEDPDGRTDEFDRPVTATRSVVDEIAAAASLLSGTLRRTPVVVIRGFGHLTRHDHGGGILEARLRYR